MSKITINDIAKIGKVSKTTVSRYLNGNYKNMSEETRNKLENIIKELNYIPNSIARSLKSKNTKLIGCTIADITNQFSSYIFKGIQDVCKENEYQLLIMDIGESARGEIEAIESLLSYNVEGLIINTAGNNEEYLINLKRERKIPIVLADRNITKENIIDVVTSDNYEAAYEMVKYLKGKGYEEIGFFTYDLRGNETRKKRRKGYIEAIIEEDMEIREYIIYKKEEIGEKVKEFVGRKKVNKAIFCMNGELLLKVLQEMKRQGIEYEKEGIGITSFDDWGWAELIGMKGITTIKQQSYECGKRCTEVLIELIKNPLKDPEYIELKTEMIERGSTK